MASGKKKAAMLAPMQIDSSSSSPVRPVSDVSDEPGQPVPEAVLQKNCVVPPTGSEPLKPGQSPEAASCAGPKAGAGSNSSVESRKGPCPLGHLCKSPEPQEIQDPVKGRGPASRTRFKCATFR
ncbi:unnamed protein product [Lampetra planeri]